MDTPLEHLRIGVVTHEYREPAAIVAWTSDLSRIIPCMVMHQRFLHVSYCRLQFWGLVNRLIALKTKPYPQLDMLVNYEYSRGDLISDLFIRQDVIEPKQKLQKVEAGAEGCKCGGANTTVRAACSPLFPAIPIH